VAAELGQYEPSPQACRHTPAPGRAAGGPRRFCLPQAPTAQTRPVFFPQAPTVQTCVSAGAPAAKLRPTTRSRRRSIAARASTIPTKPDIFTQSRCISALSFFSCCDSVAALALANCNEHVAEANISRSHPPTPSVLSTVPKSREAGMVKPLNFFLCTHHRRMDHEVSRTEELDERRQARSVDHTGLEVEKHRAWYVLATRGLVVNTRNRGMPLHIPPKPVKPL
jgi:hypothetical protein